MDGKRITRFCALLVAACILLTATVGMVPALAAKGGKSKKKAYASKIPVLTYHRVVTDEQKNSPVFYNDRYSVSLSTFKKQMQYLNEKHYTSITCEQLYLWRLKMINLPRRSVLITFDDGYVSTIKNVLPVLGEYGLKATDFIIGESSYKSDGTMFIKYEQIREVQEKYPWFEFQSHSWALHKKSAYKKCKYADFVEDAKKQQAAYGFEYVAYPYGRYSKAMIKAYKKSDLKMGFMFGTKQNGYATRKNPLFKTHRIEVSSNMSFSEFKKWCK